MGYFLKGLRPELSRGAKASYVEWKNGRLTSALMHAIHAEDQLQEKKDRKPLTIVVLCVCYERPCAQRLYQMQSVQERRALEQCVPECKV